MARASTHRQWTPLAHALTAAGDHWKLLIVLALEAGPARLTHLKERLPGISTGVLEHHVQQMVTLGLLSRQRYREMPPRVEIELTDSGRELLPIARALARWGLRHQWSVPAESERVAADALLRQLPALLDQETSLTDAIIEATLCIGPQRIQHWLQIRDGRLEEAEVADLVADASVEGDEMSWAAALGPALDWSSLSFSGDEQLATQIFDALTRTRFAVG